MIAQLVLALVLSHGTISGTVRVASGTGISGVAITITNEKTGAKKVVTSSLTGAYTATDLAPGLYSLSIEVQGYRRAVHNRKVVAGGTVTVDFDLEFKVTEEVTVNAPNAPPETSSVRPPGLEPVAVFWQHLYAGDFARPRGVFFDRKHRELWIADTKNNLVGVFTPDGVPLFSFGASDLAEPFQVAVDANDRVLVLDNDRTKIKTFSYRGEALGSMDLPGLKNAAFGALTVDDEGNLWLGENATGQVIEFTPDRKTKLRFGSTGYEEGQFQAIAGIVVTKDSIFVVDAQALAIQVFDHRGNFLRGWGKHDLGFQNFSLPAGIAVDAKGRVFAPDMLRHEVKIFDGEGTFLDRFGGMGFGPGEVMFPAGIAFDGEKRLYVVEQGNSRVQIFDEQELPVSKAKPNSSDN